MVKPYRIQIGNIEGSSQFRIITCPYDIDNELHIITSRTDDRRSHKENLGCPRCGNDIIDYIAIMEVSLFSKVPKCYTDYFNTFRFMVNNLMVTYYSMGHKVDPNMDNKI